MIRGEIRDKFAVSFCGVGVIGNIKTRGKYKQYYIVWRNMIMRCYKEGVNSAYYGSVTVCDRWLTFQNFYEDISSIDGWNKEKFENRELVLDKDLKQRRQKHKIYSPETCTWVSCKVNGCIQDKQQREFKAISPTGEIHISDNITEFARQFNLERRQISAVLHKRFKSTQGWKFYFINEEIV